MITEYLFYSPKLLACAQVKINMLHNQTQMAEAEYAFLTGLTGFGEIQTQSETLLPGIQRYDVVNRIETVAISVFSNICSLSKNMVNGIVLFI
jgi:hypothetical protein